MTVTIALPLSEKAAKACVIAADRLGVEPWELAVHALAHREGWFDPKRRMAATSEASEHGGS